MSEDEPVQCRVCSFTLVFCSYADFRSRSIFAANQEHHEVARQVFPSVGKELCAIGEDGCL